MASIRWENVTKDFGRVIAVKGTESGVQGWGVYGPAWPLWLRQDDYVAHDCGPGNTDQWDDLLRR